jgi:hypothetical protein
MIAQVLDWLRRTEFYRLVRYCWWDLEDWLIPALYVFLGTGLVYGLTELFLWLLYTGSWRSALFLLGLILYLVRNVWRFYTQKDVEYEEDEEDEYFEQQKYPVWSDRRP